MPPAAALLLLAAANPLPVAPELVADVRCVVVSLAITAAPDFSGVGAGSSLYWFGRLHGRLSDKALEDAIVA